MKTQFQIKTLSQILRLMVLTSLLATASAQDVSIPDPVLNARIRDELHKPTGPLTEQDLLSLTNLNAPARPHDFFGKVRSLEGLEAAYNLTTLNLRDNRLTEVSLLSGLTSLITLDLGGNQLTSLTLPADLTSLRTLDLRYNQLTDLTLPAGLMSLSQLNLDGNPLITFVLPEPLALTGLAGTVAYLRSQGVSVYTYPLGVGLSLVSPQRTPAGAFGFALTGPLAGYTVFGSTDLATWNVIGTVTNAVGAVVFTDAVATNSSQKFYRARLAP